jgi:gliding motility-associated-like protein
MKLFLLVICIGLFALQANAQTCQGSLGDPVINEDFGAGANPGFQLSSATTNYLYTSTGCPPDGSYTIANNVNSCFGSTWQNIDHDHTGNPNGYMMVVNASFAPGIFYTQQTVAGQLCPSTTYEFSAWIVNLCNRQACGGASILPNITFSIETTSGQVLKTYNTGDIPVTNSPQWNQYGTFFTTPAGMSQAVVVKMTNNALGGCGNDIALDDITFRACGPIIQAGFSSTGGPSSQQLCEGGSAHYVINASVQGNAGLSYQWQENIRGAGWVDVSAPAGQVGNLLNVGFLNAVPGVYQYRLGVSNGSAISSVGCRVYSPPLTITVNPLPVVPPIPSQIICQGNTLQLTASGGATYLWTGPNMQPTSQNPLIINNATPANAGTYTVVATSNLGCPAPPVQTQVTVVPKVVASVSSSAFTICAGQSAQLSASGGPYYKWTPSVGLNNDAIPNPVATPQQTTTYTVDVSNGGCDDSTKTVTVTVNKNPVADAGGNKVIFEGQSVKLNGTVGGDNITNYYWTPTTFLDDPTSLTPIATPTDDITYTLTAVSQTCGIASSDAFVRVYKKITIPNTFTPNSDGINDKWNIDALVTYPQSSIFVYNRYGQQVYQSTGYSTPWDGTYNGSPVPTGTYYYIIDLKDSQPKIAGWVAIVR